ncbi:MAG: EamA family transporter [Verrucomicrobia bacterium]|nr:EamA family transporter [Verrucomicrobiota bacterium]
MSNDDTDGTIGIELTPDRPLQSALFRGVPPEFMALGSMLSIQLGAALAVPVMSVIGSAPTTVFMSIEPAFSAILGYLILNQHLSLRQILGIGCVVTASTIAAAENRAG